MGYNLIGGDLMNESKDPWKISYGPDPAWKHYRSLVKVLTIVFATVLGLIIALLAPDFVSGVYRVLVGISIFFIIALISTLIYLIRRIWQNPV